MSIENARNFAKEQCERFTLESLAPKTNFLLETKDEDVKAFLSRIKYHKRFTKGEELYNLVEKKFEPMTSKELHGEYGATFEVSNRILECQCPLNLDTYGGFCTYNCMYCFVQYYSQSLYSAYYDNWTPTYLSVANKDKMRKDLIDLIEGKKKGSGKRGGISSKESMCSDLEVIESFKHRIPLKIGNRTECFQNIEKSMGITLEALKICKDYNYPIIINTKTTLIREEPYFNLITSFGKDVLIQETITTPDDDFARVVEPGAPSSTERFKTIKIFTDVGIRAIPRMEPPLLYLRNEINVDKEFNDYLRKVSDSGAKMVLSDTYSNTVVSPDIRHAFYDRGLDYDRMYYAQAEYQELGSAMQAKFFFEAKKLEVVWNPSYTFQTSFLQEKNYCCGCEDRQIHNRFNTFTAGFEILKKGRLTWKEFSREIALTDWVIPRLKAIWNHERLDFPWNLEFTTGVVAGDIDNEGNLVYIREFDDNPFLDTLKYLGDKYESNKRIGKNN